MKQIISVMFVVCIIFFATNVFAGDIINVAWNVNSLSDDSGAPIVGLDLDMELGIHFLAVHGAALFEKAVAGCDGTGLIDGNTAHLFLNLQSYFLIGDIDLTSGNGAVHLYNSGQQLIDSGTITIKSIQ